MTGPLPPAPQGPFLAAAPVVRTHRLALGLQVVDALRGEPADVAVAVEEVPPSHAMPRPAVREAAAALYNPGMGLPRLTRGRHPGRFRLLFGDRVAPPVRVRVYDTARRFVPRRLEVPFASLAAVLAEEASGARPAARARRIAVFPGTAYSPQGNATGVRGRVVGPTGGPVRWVRVTAWHSALGTVLGHAHGDDRGEFLLVLGVPPTSHASPSGSAFTVRLTLAARSTPPPAGSAVTRHDPFADLPLEVLPPVGTPDDVSDGMTVPDAHAARSTVVVPLLLGRLVSPPSPFILP
ncbi:hypothetical protein [Streptomyces tagetis]|uniref:Uncharacterized protein n=1 Tax=Streptomyces tagetis TaxID=2820809 RepID=A0A941B6Q7_9ACTN|nr:hypothetical protein [Streptomyces sp. RG38]MBQ0826633.1 hypothetical protein [Streptomyces sp. RG38]